MNMMILLGLSNIMHLSVESKRSISYPLYNNKINTIYGTGNILSDIVYRAYCDTICLSRCCATLLNNSTMTCLTQGECNKFLLDYQVSFMLILLEVYSAIVFLAVITVFIAYSSLTQTKKNKWRNGLVAALLVLGICCIIPALVIWVIAYKEGKSMFIVIGGIEDSQKEILQVHSEIDRKNIEDEINKFKMKRKSDSGQKNIGSDSIRNFKESNASNNNNHQAEITNPIKQLEKQEVIAQLEKV